VQTLRARGVFWTASTISAANVFNILVYFGKSFDTIGPRVQGVGPDEKKSYTLSLNLPIAIGIGSDTSDIFKLPGT
jgi:hypothetical protein